MDSEARVAEIVLLEGEPAARISCEPNQVPAPGRYLLAHAVGGDGALAAPLFCSRSLADGFMAAPPIPHSIPPLDGLSWSPGTRLRLRGPLGRGFSLPPAARRVALAALDAPLARLISLVAPALDQGASVVVLSNEPPADLPLAVEVLPLSSLREACGWADYVALDAARPNLPRLKHILGLGGANQSPQMFQVLVRAPVPCGGLAECGVCAVDLPGGWRLVCKDGPVFDLAGLIQ